MSISGTKTIGVSAGEVKDPFLGLELKTTSIEVLFLLFCSYILSQIGSFLFSYFFGVAIGSVALYVLYVTGVFWGHVIFKTIRTDERRWEDYIRDFSAQSEYASFFLSAILIFFGLVADKSADFSFISKIYLSISLVTAVMCICFWPVDKPQNDDYRRVKVLWVWKLMMLSASTFFALGGIFLTIFWSCTVISSMHETFLNNLCWYKEANI